MDAAAMDAHSSKSHPDGVSRKILESALVRSKERKTTMMMYLCAVCSPAVKFPSAKKLLEHYGNRHPEYNWAESVS